jgi:hypothetical protein
LRTLAAVPCGEAVIVAHLPAQGHAGIEDRAGLGRPAGAVAILLEDELEAVAGLDVALEIDVEAHRLDHLGHDRQWHAGIRARLIEAGADRARMPLDADREGARDLSCGEAAIRRARHLDVPLDALVQQERDQPAGRILRKRRREADADLLARLQMPRLVDAAQRDDRRIRLFATDPRIQEQFDHGLAALDRERLVQHERNGRLVAAGHFDRTVAAAVHQDIVPCGEFLLGVVDGLQRAPGGDHRRGDVGEAFPAQPADRAKRSQTEKKMNDSGAAGRRSSVVLRGRHGAVLPCRLNSPRVRSRALFYA